MKCEILQKPVKGYGNVVCKLILVFYLLALQQKIKNKILLFGNRN